MTTPPESDEPLPARPITPRSQRNVFAQAALIVGLIATTLALLSPNRTFAFAPALIGVVVSGVAIAVGVRRDVRVTAAVAGLLLNLFALAVAVFAVGARAGGRYGG